MFYGRHYFLTMALIARLYDEAGFYKQLAKDLQAQGTLRSPTWPVPHQVTGLTPSSHRS
jgi:hypothetical protein